MGSSFLLGSCGAPCWAHRRCGWFLDKARGALAWMWEAVKGPQEQRKGCGVEGIPRAQRGPVLLWGSTVPSTWLKNKMKQYIYLPNQKC